MLDKLKALTKDKTFPSEQDWPFQVVHWDARKELSLEEEVVCFGIYEPHEIQEVNLADLLTDDDLEDLDELMQENHARAFKVDTDDPAMFDVWFVFYWQNEIVGVRTKSCET